MGQKACCCASETEDAALLVQPAAFDAGPDPASYRHAEVDVLRSPKVVAADEVPPSLLVNGDPFSVASGLAASNGGPPMGVGSRVRVLSSGQLGTIRGLAQGAQAWSVELDRGGRLELTGSQLARAVLADELRGSSVAITHEPTEEIQDEGLSFSAKKKPSAVANNKAADSVARTSVSSMSSFAPGGTVPRDSVSSDFPMARLSGSERDGVRPIESPELIAERVTWIEKLQDPAASWTLKLLPESYMDDYDVVLAAVEMRGEDLQYASPRLRDDKEIVMTAVQQTRRALDHASPRLRAHPDVLRLLPRRMSVQSGQGIELDQAKKSSCIIALCGVTEAEMRAEWHLRAKNGEPLATAPTRFQDDPKIVAAAVLFDPCALQYASARLRDDDEFVMDCIRGGHKVLQYASERLKYDPEMVAASEKSQWIECLGIGGVGNWLSDAPEHLRDDEQVVLAAAHRSCHANLEFASARLLDSKEFMLQILEAGTTPSHALQYASMRVRADREVMLAAVQSCLPQHAALLLDLVPRECQAESWYAEFKALVKKKKDFAVYVGITDL